MQIGLSSATIPTSGLANDIRVAGETGFDTLELLDSKLIVALKGGSLNFLKKLMKKHGVAPLSIGILENILTQDREEQATLESQCYAMASSAAKLGAPWIVASLGRTPGGMPRDEALSRLVETLRFYAEIAPMFGKVGLAFEFTGYPDSPVRTLAQARALLAEVGSPNTAIVLDTFHFHLGGSSPEEILKTKPEEIAFVQVSDATPEASGEKDKLLPGEGVADLTGIVGALKSIGYDGAYSVEVVGERYQGIEPEEMAEKAMEAARGILQVGGVKRS